MLKLFKYMKPFAALIAASLTLVFFQSLSELYLPTLMADLVDTGIAFGNTGYILKIGGFMLLISLGGVACSILATFYSSRIATGFGRNLRRLVFARVESFSLNEFNKFGTATLITRTTNDINQIQLVIMMMMRIMVSAPLMAVGGIILAVSQDLYLSLILISILPFLALVIFSIARKGLPLFKSIQKKIDGLNLILREYLSGIRVIRAFNRTDHEEERFYKANYDLTATSITVNKLMALMMPSMMLIMNLTVVGIIWFGGIRINTGNMQVGDLMAFIQYAMLIMFSLVMMSMLFVFIPRAQVSAGRINEVLETVPEIKDEPNPRDTEQYHKSIEFRNVTFSYPGAERPVLNNITFTAKPGEVTAIIGGTGSGKTTLVNLLPRFYDPDSGSILINGQDIRKIPQAELRSKLGFVPQKAVLFTGSIADNIRYGKEDAPEAEVIQAAEISQAAEFIDNMDDGYNTQVAQGGTNLSGGQKQRLAIARALVRKPEIYIFDDCFSALDYKTDAKLRLALKKETAGSIVLIVSQRAGTVMDADQVVVLDKGRIAGIGKHKDLLKSCRVYQEIVSSQLSGEELA